MSQGSPLSTAHSGYHYRNSLLANNNQTIYDNDKSKMRPLWRKTKPPSDRHAVSVRPDYVDPHTRPGGPPGQSHLRPG